jgi:hypothetical protein
LSIETILMLGCITNLAFFPQLENSTPSRGFYDAFSLFCLALGFGFGWNVHVLEGVQ